MIRNRHRATPRVLTPREKQAATAQHLGWIVCAVGAFSVSPAVWEWYHLATQATPVPLPGWVPAALLCGLILFSLGLYLCQIPDWSALWMVAGALLAVAASYAAVLATTLLGSFDTSLVAWLDFADKLAGQRASIWCGAMIALSTISAYFVGQEGVRWYNRYRLQRKPTTPADAVR